MPRFLLCYSSHFVHQSEHSVLSSLDTNANIKLAASHSNSSAPFDHFAAKDALATATIPSKTNRRQTRTSVANPNTIIIEEEEVLAVTEQENQTDATTSTTQKAGAKNGKGRGKGKTKSKEAVESLSLNKENDENQASFQDKENAVVDLVEQVNQKVAVEQQKKAEQVEKQAARRSRSHKSATKPSRSSPPPSTPTTETNNTAIASETEPVVIAETNQSIAEPSPRKSKRKSDDFLRRRHSMFDEPDKFEPTFYGGVTPEPSPQQLKTKPTTNKRNNTPIPMQREKVAAEKQTAEVAMPALEVEEVAAVVRSVSSTESSVPVTANTRALVTQVINSNDIDMDILRKLFPSSSVSSSSSSSSSPSSSTSTTTTTTNKLTSEQEQEQKQTQHQEREKEEREANFQRMRARVAQAAAAKEITNEIETPQEQEQEQEQESESNVYSPAPHPSTNPITSNPVAYASVYEQGLDSAREDEKMGTLMWIVLIALIGIVTGLVVAKQIGQQ